MSLVATRDLEEATKSNLIMYFFYNSLVLSLIWPETLSINQVE